MTKDEYIALASTSIDKHFPKGVAKERGEAMMVIADLLRFLMDKGVVKE